MSVTKPMRAGKVVSIETLRYPLIASPKVDGIRCWMVDGKPMSRTMKEIPNRYIFNTMANSQPKGELFGPLAGLDGELIVANKPFNEVSGDIMREAGEPDFRYLVFDCWPSNAPYVDRLRALHDRKLPKFAEVLEYKWCHKVADLQAYEELCVSRGYEGVMVRDPQGLYKHGTSTVKEQGLLKLKRFDDAEARIIGYEEEMYNGNEAEKDAYGRTKRSSHKDNLSGKGTLGALKVEDLTTGIAFDIGTGFSKQQREDYWTMRNSLIGRIVKYKYQPAGVKEKPRFPSFIGFRHKDDIV